MKSMTLLTLASPVAMRYSLTSCRASGLSVAPCEDNASMAERMDDRRGTASGDTDTDTYREGKGERGGKGGEEWGQGQGLCEGGNGRGEWMHDRWGMASGDTDTDTYREGKAGKRGEGDTGTV